VYDVVKYVIDSNVLIESHRFYYHSDFFREFWDYMSVLIERHIVFIPPEVALEIGVGKDFLSEFWLKNIQTMPVDKDESMFAEVVKIVTEKYKPEKVQEFLQGADPHVIAWAIQLEAYIVTNEKPIGIYNMSIDKDGKYVSSIKIPDVVMLLKKEGKKVPHGVLQLWDIVRGMKETFLVEKPYKLGEDVK